MRLDQILLFIDTGRPAKIGRPNDTDFAKLRAAHLLNRWRAQRLPVLYIAAALSFPRRNYRRDFLRAAPTDVLIDHQIHSPLSVNQKFTDLLGDWDAAEIVLIGGSLDGVVLRTFTDGALSHYRWTIVRDATWIDRCTAASAASVLAVTTALLEPHAAFASSCELLDRIQADAPL